MNFSLCPSYFKIIYPDSITDFIIKGLLNPKLSVNWSNIQFTTRPTIRHNITEMSFNTVTNKSKTSLYFSVAAKHAICLYDGV